MEAFFAGVIFNLTFIDALVLFLAVSDYRTCAPLTKFRQVGGIDG